MRRTLFFALTFLFASLALAAPQQTAFNPAGTLYTIAVDDDLPLLELTRRGGDDVKTLLVPSTEDEAIDSDARILWDDATQQLFVIWHSRGAEADAIRLITLSSKGEWSEPITIATDASSSHDALQVVLTHVGADQETTLLHAAWWKIAAADQQPEYALVAFDVTGHISTDVANLHDLAAIREAGTKAEIEPIAVQHPPLAMTRTFVAGEVDIVFGAQMSTALTRVKLRPKLIAGQTRMWRPGRSGGAGIPKAGFVTSDGAPVQALLSGPRVVLYAPEKKFRYVVYDDLGAWSPARTFTLDESLSEEQLVEHLRQAVEAEATDEGTPEEE